MKLKNINFFQKYVDLMVIALAVLIGLYVLWSYLLSNPYAVEYSGGGTSARVSPADLPRRQLELARQLEAGVNSTRNPLGELPTESYPYLEEFVERLTRSHMQMQLAFGSHGLPGGYVKLDGGEMMAYYVPTPPAPENVRASASYGVLASHDELVQHFAQSMRSGSSGDTRVAREAARLADRLAALIGNPSPRDFQSVTVGAVFNLRDLQERYDGPARGGLQKLPDNWWWGSLVVTDVILERETWDEASGEWTDRTRIDLLPGQPDLRTPRDEYDQSTLTLVMSTLQQFQTELSNPPFPPLAEYSRPWRSPFSEQKDLTMEDRRELVDVRKRINETERRIEQLATRIAERAARQQQAGNRPTVNRPTPFEELGPIGGNRPRTTPNRPQQPRQQRDPDAEQLGQLQEQLVQLQTRYAELAGDEAAVLPQQHAQRFNPNLFMGGMPMGPGGYPAGPFGPGHPGLYGPGFPGQEMYGPMDPAFGGGFPGNIRRPGVPNVPGQTLAGEETLVEDGRVRIWSHDLTVEPGRTYRYRVVVSVLNPLFQRRNLTEEQREQYFNQLVLESEPSEWTEPVRTRSVPQWFVESVNPNAQQATVEVWRVFDGMPSFARFTVSPGDPISREVTMTSNDGIDRTVQVDVPVVIVDTYTEANDLGSDVGALLYLDLQSKTLKSRRPDKDRNSVERVELESERMLRGELATPNTRPNVRPTRPLGSIRR